jgi:nicotinate-nucleotide adenylyltransferase
MTRHAHPVARPRAIGIFGGSFDPVHVGHLAVARAAQRRFHLDQVHFVVAGRAPHKARAEATPFPHRFAMVALACAENVHFVPSLAEAGDDHSGRHVHYSIDTVRGFRRALAPHDALHFIVGADQFLELPTWRSPEALLEACHFIVVSRPGFRMNALRLVIPPELLAPKSKASAHTISLRHTSVHLLDTVHSHVSATEVRRRRHRGQSIHGLVPPRVEDYILRQALYL